MHMQLPNAYIIHANPNPCSCHFISVHPFPHRFQCRLAGSCFLATSYSPTLPPTPFKTIHWAPATAADAYFYRFRPQIEMDRHFNWPKLSRKYKRKTKKIDGKKYVRRDDVSTMALLSHRRVQLEIWKFKLRWQLPKHVHLYTALAHAYMKLTNTFALSGCHRRFNFQAALAYGMFAFAYLDCRRLGCERRYDDVSD